MDIKKGKINLYLHMKRTLSQEEKRQILLLQKEDITVIEVEDNNDCCSFQNNNCNGSVESVSNIQQIKICISDDYDILRQAYNAGWVVIVCLDELSKEQEKTMDCSFVRYAIDSLTAIDRTYLLTVYCRCKGIPQMITQTDRLRIKEISLSDMDDLMEIFNSNDRTEFFEPFYGSREEAEEYLDAYIKDVYCYYDYGIWGVYLKDAGKMIGIAGFTPRSDMGEKPILELGYAIAKSYQGQGYAKEACNAVIKYAQENLEYEKIIKITSNGVQKISG